MHSINLIIGCGYLGTRLFHLLKEQQCYVTNRSEKQIFKSAGLNNHGLILNVNDKSSWSNLSVLAEERGVIIIFMVTPRQIDTAIFPEFIQHLNKLNVKRAVLVSSTVVYGNNDRIVDADSDVKIDSERAERQYQIEQAWLDNMKSGSVIRLAGIYGPNRVIGRSGIINNEIINGDPDGWLNLIHVDDAAQLVKCISEMDNPNSIELGCDGNPIKRGEYYSFLAEQLNRASPIFSHDSRERGMGRRCDNNVTISRSGWQPMHVDFRKAVSNLIKQNEN